MGHTKYHTDAFVVHSFERGEADRVFVLITKELGKVYGYAKSVRKLESRHRFGLQPFSQSEVSLVRGKGGMRIVHVAPKVNMYQELAPYSKNLSVFQNIVRLAERLVPQDEPLEEVFQIIEATGYTLKKEMYPASVAAVEAGAALGILHALGYVQHESPFTDLATEAVVMHTGYLEAVSEKRPQIIKEINRALQASQL